MLQRTHIGLAVALLATASLQAPFAHVHPGDSDHHHATGFVHTHLSLADHDDSAPEIESHEDDETTINLDWAPAAAHRLTVIYVTSIAPAPARPTVVQLGTAPEFIPRSNSPPIRLHLPARAPPV
jgi:hypothetical protein